MLGIEPKAARYTWTAAAVILLLGLIYVVRVSLFVFVLALLFGYLLSPLVDFLDRVLPSRRTRTPALALAYLIFIGIVVLVGLQIGTRVVEQANTLIKGLPNMLAAWQQPSPSASDSVNSFKEQVIARTRAEIAARSNDILSALPRAGLKAISVASNLIYVVLIPILGFFFLKDAKVLRKHLLEMVDDGPNRALLTDLLHDIHILLAQYIRALVLLALATFAVYNVFFVIVGVPFSVLLSALAGLLEFIPVVGPLTAGVAILVVAGVSNSHVLGVLIFLLAYRMFQDYVLSPHLMAQGVELHPLLVMFGVFAGGEVAGIPGTFLSVPILALARVAYVRFRKARIPSELKPTPPTTALLR